MTVPELRTVEQLAAELWPAWNEKRRRRWIYRAHEEHDLPGIKVGRQLVFDVAAVRAWLDTQSTNDVGRPPAPNAHHLTDLEDEE
jgi:hypothetical protein